MIMCKKVPKGFCKGCCYDNNPREELNCNKVQCCYLVRKHCILVDGYVDYEYD